MKVVCVLTNAVDKNGDVLSAEAFQQLAQQIDPEALFVNDGRAVIELELPDETDEAVRAALCVPFTHQA